LPTPSQESDGVLLSCVVCGNHETFGLNAVDIGELQRQGQLRLYCDACRGFTTWVGVQKERRSETDRRTSRRTLMMLPIRVRCDLPALRFTEVTRTLTASRTGASFITHRALSEGMMVYVVMPYSKEDPALLERHARVVRVEKKESGFEVGIEFLS
jgi:hypothetical protein